MRNLFNRHLVGNPERKLKVMVAMEGYPSDRGDYQGWIGIGKRIAQKLGAEYFQSDASIISRLSDEELFHFYTKIIGVPDIILGNYLPFELMRDYINSGARHITYEMNEWHHPRVQTSLSLAPHALDHQSLERQGDFLKHKFRINKPLVGIMVCTSYTTIEDVEGVIKAIKKLGKATIMICPLRRGESSNTDTAVKYLRTELDDNFDIMYFPYDDCAKGYNPYKGLLNASNYMVILGESYSIQSEILFCGKPVHFGSYPSSLHGIEDKSVILNYYRENELSNQRFESMDVTDAVADAEVEDYIASLNPLQLMRKINHLLPD